MTSHQGGHDELQPVVDRLRAERATMTPLELDALKQRVLANAARSAPTTRRSFSIMRTRAAILAMLSLGFLLSTAGAGLAVGGLADNDQASKAQYPPTPPAPPENNTPPAPPTTPESVPPATPPPTGGEVLPEEEQSTPPQESTPPQDQVLPDQGGTAPDSSEVQPARQLESAAASESLPFTGFAALPVLLLGLALLAGGLVMRRSTRAD
jgi:hypothetical protein